MPMPTKMRLELKDNGSFHKSSFIVILSAKLRKIYIFTYNTVAVIQSYAMFILKICDKSKYMPTASTAQKIVARYVFSAHQAHY